MATTETTGSQSDSEASSTSIHPEEEESGGEHDSGTTEEEEGEDFASDADSENEGSDEETDDAPLTTKTHHDGAGDSADEAAPLAGKKTEAKKKIKKVHKLSLSQTEDFNEKLNRRGVVYVARVPPRMTPTKVKSLLCEYGEVTRIYLVEEDAAIRRRRRKLSGNGSKRYVEGWVEFADKKVAKHVAASLNATPITNYKRDPHYGDLWALKYLRKFKWSHLTEKVAYERRVREQKLRLETMQARRETVAYKQLVETGKKLDKIEERKRRRAEKEGKTDGALAEAHSKKKHRPPQLKPFEADANQSTKKSLLGALV